MTGTAWSANGRYYETCNCDFVCRSVTAGDLLDMAAQGAMGMNPNATGPLQMDNTGHPAADRITLARALRTHLDALGLSFHETSGRNYGQYAPFSWRSA